ncbi:MAG: response regulator [Cyclobacteriaceae bacterium]
MKNLKFQSVLLSIFIVSLSISSLVFGQDISNLKFKKIGIENGLSSTTVSSILQDEKGYLWFGTRNGLNKYDGYNIKTYYNQLNSDSTLQDNWIYSLFEDAKGRLWISTLTGVNIYDEDLDKVIRVKDTDGILQGLSVRQINKGIGKNILFSSKKGLFTFSSEDSLENGIQLTRLVENPILSSFIDGSKIWVASTDGIYQYNTQTKLTYKVFDYDKRAISYNFKINFFKEINGSMLVSLPGGLYQWEEESNSFIPYHFIDIDGNTHTFNSAVRTIVQDSQGVLWIGTYEGLYLIDTESRKLAKYTHSPQDLYSLSHNSVHVIVEDGERNMWIGTWAGGVNFFDRNLLTFNHFYSTQSNKSLSNNIVSSFFEDENDKFWVGTEGGGLNLFDRKLGAFERVDYGFAIEPEANIKKVIKDRNGNLWIGLHYHGLVVYNPETGENRKFIHNPDDKSSLSSSTIVTIDEDRNGNIWIGTTEGGINLYLGDGKFKRYDNDSWMANSSVFSFYEKKDGLLLFGTNIGLIVFDPAKHTYAKLPILAPDSGQQININCIYSADDETFWLGSSSHGLVKFNLSTNQTKIYHTGNGLPNNLVYGILPEDDSLLWVSTNRGLSRLNVRTENFENFDIANGLQSNVFNYNSYLKSSKGEMFFGGVNGFNLFDPKKISSTQGEKPVYISSLKIFNQDVNIGDSNGLLVKNISNTKKIELEPGQFNFTLEFVSLNYTSPQSTEYLYKLDGFDHDWTYAGNQRLANYNNIEPGEYTFFVKTQGSQESDSISMASLEITVLPPWWKTWWAYTLYLVLIAGTIAVYRKFRSSQLKLRQGLMQAQLDTENEKRIYDLKLKFFTNVSHELKTPLTLMLGPAEELVSHSWKSAALKERALLLYNQSKKMYHLVNQLLDFRKTETGNMKLRAERGDISKFVNEIYLVFKLKAEEKGIQYSFKSIDQEIPAYFDRDKLEIVFTNLLSNAFKLTPEMGHIKLDVDYVGSPYEDGRMLEGKLNDNYVSISVSDNGLGMTPSQVEKVFDRFYQTLTSETLSISGTGIGLSLVRDLIDLHHGQIELESAQDEGTKFSIKIPFGKKHLKPDEILATVKSSNESSYYREFNSENELAELPLINQKNGQEFTILLVDDNQDLLSYLKDLLSTDFSILSAEDGLEALEIIQEHQPDMIISDVMMPRMDGITLCKKINEDNAMSHIPFILLTARTATVYEIEGLTIGATDYLTKPFNPKVLQAKVHNIFINKLRLHEYYEKAILAEHFDLEIPDEEKEFIEKAIKYVEENVEDQEFNVLILAQHMAMSQSTFYKKLKSLTGKTVIEFIRDVRMRVASQLLLNSNYRVSDISHKVGITDTKYFRESFKKVYGASPSEFKRIKEAEGIGKNVN